MDLNKKLFRRVNELKLVWVPCSSRGPGCYKSCFYFRRLKGRGRTCCLFIHVRWSVLNELDRKKNTAVGGLWDPVLLSQLPVLLLRGFSGHSHCGPESYKMPVLYRCLLQLVSHSHSILITLRTQNWAESWTSWLLFSQVFSFVLERSVSPFPSF